MLRFYPDPAYGYEYPELYVNFFGADYEPEPYVERAYEQTRNHKWYGTRAPDHGQRHLLVRSER